MDEDFQRLLLLLEKSENRTNDLMNVRFGASVDVGVQPVTLLVGGVFLTGCLVNRAGYLRAVEKAQERMKNLEQLLVEQVFRFPKLASVEVDLPSFESSEGASVSLVVYLVNVTLWLVPERSLAFLAIRLPSVQSWSLGSPELLPETLV